MSANRAAKIHLAAYLIAALFLSALLSACDSSFKPAPPPADPAVGRVVIDVTPDGLNTPWTLAYLSDRYEGVGDSVLTVSRAGTYSLYGKTADDLVPRPMPGPQTGDVAMGDSLVFDLLFAQVPWRRTYQGTGDGAWHDILLLEDGGGIVCGTQDGQTRLARLDHSGNLVWDLTGMEAGSSVQILPLANDQFLVASDQDDAVTLSCRDLSGGEVWSQVLDFSQNMDLTGMISDGHGGYFVLVTLFFNDVRSMYPVLSHLGGGGELLSQDAAVTEGRVLAAGLASRADGGCYVMQEHLTETGKSSLGLELVVADSDGVMAETPVFTAPLMDFGAGIQPCAGGDVLLTCIAALPGGDSQVYSTRVIRLSSRGHIEWEKYIGGVTSERLMICECSDDGSFLLAGNGWTGAPDQLHTRLMRLDSAGMEIMDAEQYFNPGARPFLTAARTAWDGGVFAIGASDHWGSAKAYPLILRTDTFGGMK